MRKNNRLHVGSTSSFTLHARQSATQYLGLFKSIMAIMGTSAFVFGSKIFKRHFSSSQEQVAAIYVRLQNRQLVHSSLFT